MNKEMNMLKKIKKWLQGPYIPYSEDDIRVGGYYDPSILAKTLGIIGRFLLNHWEWLIATGLALIMYFGFFKN